VDVVAQAAGLRPGPATAAPHDLLRLRAVSDLVVPVPLPSWARRALARAPLVVVRGARAPAGLVAVGIRGPKRHQRLAALVAPSAATDRIAPEALAAQAAWSARPPRGGVPALAALPPVSALLGRLGLAWGPTGSVGFELAAGVPTARPDSDLDLLVRRGARWPVAEAREALSALDRLAVRADVQVETPAGTFALAEYARRRAPILLRTADGPRLVEDPWGPSAAR